MTNGTSPPLALLKNLFETQLLSKYDKHLFFAEVLDSKPALSKLDDSEAPMRFQFALTRPSTSTASQRTAPARDGSSTTIVNAVSGV